MSGDLRKIAEKHARRWAGRVTLGADGRFECPRHAGALTLSPAACGRLYQRALAAERRSDPAEMIAVAPCLGCKIGAAHAAADPGAAVADITPTQRCHESVVRRRVRT